MTSCAYCLHTWKTDRCQYSGSDWCNHERQLEDMAHAINNPPYLDADGNADWPEPEPAESHLPLTMGEWNTDKYGRTLSGPGVCGTCDGGGCRDCIG